MTRTGRIFLATAASLALAVGLLWLLGAATPPARAEPSLVRYVATTGTDAANDCTAPLTPCLTVQHAVDQAAPNDEIRVAEGTYTGTNSYGGLSQVVYISKSIEIRGGFSTTNWTTPDPDAHPTILDAEGQGRVLYITGDISATLEGLTITGGDATGLGGEEYGADSGGGVRLISATLTVYDCTVRANTASTRHSAVGGGLAAYSAVVSLTTSLISGNLASAASGGWGGGIALVDSLYAISDTSVVSNTGSTAPEQYGDESGGLGAGLLLVDSFGSLTGGLFQDNVASTQRNGSGGGIYAAGGQLEAHGIWVMGNTASQGNEGLGGGLDLMSCNATISSSHIISNTASGIGMGYGGGLLVGGGELQLLDSEIRGNLGAPGDAFGGGMNLYSTTAFLRNNCILTNTASSAFGGYGGGVYLLDTSVTLDGNLIRGNVAAATDIPPPPISGAGGGLYATDGSVVLLNNRILENVANLSGDGWGGGLFLGGNGFTLENNMVADNHAMSGGAGSGIYLSGAVHQLRHNTIANNAGGDSSGVHLGTRRAWWEGGVYPISQVALTDTIIAGHQYGVTATAQTTITLESTLWWGNGQDWAGAGVVTATNNYTGAPDFVPGPMDDYHIGTGSAALDRGVDAGVLTDIDGDPRPLFLGPDLGADEAPYPRFRHRLPLPSILRR